MTSPYYCPSGRVPLTAIPLTILCCVAALPGAWLYAWLAIHTPFFVLFFFALAFAIYLGFIARYAALHAKVRNPRWMGKLGVVIGLVGWYCQWAAWIAMTLHAQAHLANSSVVGIFTDVAANPGFVASFLTEVSRTGAWEIGGHRIAGGVLIAIWLAELALLFGFPHLFGRMQAGEPFCEASNSWAEAIELPHKFAFIDQPLAVAQFLQTHPEQVFSVLKAWSEDESLSYSKVTVYRCRGGDDPYISITNAEVALTGGKVKEEKKPASNYLRLPGMDPDEVIRLCAQAARNQSDSGRVPDLSDPPELRAAIAHLEAGEHEATLNAAQPYVAAGHASLRIDARRLCALACSRLGRWNEAFDFWSALYDEERTAHNALQAATSSVMAGELQRGVTWITKSIEMNAESHELPVLMIQTNFVTALTQSGQMKAALPYLDEIKQVYVKLRVTDPTFLYAHRVPLFNAFLDNSAPVISVALDPEQGHAWYASMLPHLDDEGRTQLSAWLKDRFTPQNSQPESA